MIYYLFLDDVRKPFQVTWEELPLVNWTVARSYDDFVKLVTLMGVPSCVSFDHDLADEHYEDYRAVAPNEARIIDPLKLNYKKYKVKSGYHAAKWLAAYCTKHKQPIPEYHIHTLNHIGRRNISNLLEGAKK